MSEAYLKQVQLPSQGKMYDGKIPDGLVTLEPLGTREEKMFSAGSNNGAVILDKVFDSCVKCPIPHKKLVLGDRLFLLLQLRSITYGREYSYSYLCTECSRKSYAVLDLDSLPVKHPDPNVDDASTFKVRLPLVDQEVTLRLLTGEDEEKVAQYVRQIASKTRSNAGDAEFVYRLAKRVVAIDGDDKIGIRDAMEFIEKLKGRDSVAIRDAIDDNDIGPDLLVTPSCISCGFESEAFGMPLDSEFFRPRRRGAKPDAHIAAAEHLDASARR